MYKLLAVLTIVIGVSAVSLDAQPKPVAPPRPSAAVAQPAPPVAISIAPLEMTGMRGANPPVTLQLEPLEMKGMRGVPPLALDIAPLEMHGMRGAIAPVNLQLNPFEMTGMRGASPLPTAIRH